jgi:hypothetical protein
VATLLKAGTWYSRSFFWLYEQLLMNSDEASERWGIIRRSTSALAPAPIDLAKAITSRQLHDKQDLRHLKMRPLYVCHAVCPGYSEAADPMRAKWDKLAFYTPGYNYGEELMGNDAKKPLNPLRNDAARIVYLYRNPLDQFVSCWEHAKKHVDERNRQKLLADGTLASITDFNDFVFEASALDSFIKHYHSFLYMKTNFPDNVIMIAYEELTRSPHVAFGRMLTHFDRPVATELERHCVAEALRLCSFDSMRNVEKKIGRSVSNDQSGSHIRDGRIGQWRDHLGEEDVQRVEQRLNEFDLSLEQFTLA